MFVKNVKSVLVLISLISWVIGICNSTEEYMFEDYFNDPTIINDEPHFKQKIYTAIIDGISMELHGPIVLENCSYIDPLFELDLSQSNYLPVSNEIQSMSSSNSCTLMFPKIFVKRKDEDEGPFAGFITIKAMDKNRIVDVTSVILLPIPATKNLKVIFDVNGTEYIILNYFYLKIIFMGLLLTTLVLVTIELKDLYDKVKEYRYSELETPTSI